MLVRIVANREDTDQTASQRSDLGLHSVRQLVFIYSTVLFIFILEITE